MVSHQANHHCGQLQLDFTRELWERVQNTHGELSHPKDLGYLSCSSSLTLRAVPKGDNSSGFLVCFACSSKELWWAVEVFKQRVADADSWKLLHCIDHGELRGKVGICQSPTMGHTHHPPLSLIMYLILYSSLNFLILQVSISSSDLDLNSSCTLRLLKFKVNHNIFICSSHIFRIHHTPDTVLSVEESKMSATWFLPTRSKLFRA